MANSTEIDPNTSDPVVIDMPEHTQGNMGGTMRLGKRKTFFQRSGDYVSKLSKYTYVLQLVTYVGSSIIRLWIAS